MTTLRLHQLGLRLSLVLTALCLTGSVVADDKSSSRYTQTVLAIRAAEPAVVNIEGNKPAPQTAGSRSDVQQVNGMGAGVIIDPRGYILTNQHVIQDVSRIEVTLHNGRRYIGKLIARHPETDLAMIKIDSNQQLPVIRCGTSSDLMRGEPVIAIGNPFGYHHTVTEGIISALHRDIPVNGVQDYPDLIQTDASINPGNSGGPLLNAEGDMIGINAAVRIGAQGIGFAIPVDRASEVAADMINQYRRRATLSGIRVRTQFGEGSVRLVVADAGESSLQSGDIITGMGGRPVRSRLDYELALVGQRSGADIEIETQRDGEVQLAQATLRATGTSRVQLASANKTREQALYKLGLQLDEANSAQVQRVDSSYRGGLRVRSVRRNSPAYHAEIQVGDILVGLKEWQTPDWSDLDWVFSELGSASTTKFHIVRGNEVFWGTMDLSSGIR